MGKYGFKSGYGQFQNIQSGIDTADGTTNISFDEAMRNNPSVVLESISDTGVSLDDVGSDGFTASPDGAGQITFHWIAFDDSEKF